MLDLLKAQVVEVRMSHEGVLWVNVDGKCAVRIGETENLVIDQDTVNKSVTGDQEIDNGDACPATDWDE